jgi:sigma-B regulation protein RsbU (phosphoserine phosphatase)
MRGSKGGPRGFRSLTTRLIVWTLLAVGGVYVATVVLSSRAARRMAIAAAEREAVNETEAAVSRVEDVLHSIEERTLALGEALSVLDARGQEADRLLRRFVQGNRDVYGGAIAWAPTPGGETRALYYHWARDGEGELQPADLASDAYRYWEREWFRDPIRTGHPIWTEPYPDRGGGDAWMVTYAVPFGAEEARAAGVVTADVRLPRLDAIVKDVELGRNGFGVLLSRSGFVIAASVGGPPSRGATLPLAGLAAARARVRRREGGSPGG